MLSCSQAKVLHKEVLKPVVLLLGCNYACYSTWFLTKREAGHGWLAHLKKNLGYHCIIDIGQYWLIYKNIILDWYWIILLYIYISLLLYWIILVTWKELNNSCAYPNVVSAGHHLTVRAHWLHRWGYILTLLMVKSMVSCRFSDFPIDFPIDFPMNWGFL